MELGGIGIWANGAVYDDATVGAIEAAGFGAVWIGGSPAHDLAVPRRILEASESIVVATGISTIWAGPPGPLAAAYHALVADHPDRFLLGLGVAHPERIAEAAAPPVESMSAFLDGLEAEGVPLGRVVLAALGPGMLTLSRDRAGGAHPFLVTPQHSAEARGILGSGPLLAPEQHVILEEDAAVARALATPLISPYLGYRNYRRSFERLGFSPEEAANGSDALTDALVACGASGIRERIRAHHEAGADHVALNLLVPGRPPGADDFRALAAAVLPAG